MKAAVARDLESRHQGSERRPTLGLVPAVANHEGSGHHRIDATQGRQIGSEPYDDATQGRQIGSEPDEDATQGRQIGSDRRAHI